MGSASRLVDEDVTRPEWKSCVKVVNSKREMQGALAVFFASPATGKREPMSIFASFEYMNQVEASRLSN
ncbi:hypothetical protein H5410_057987 [Solanum commersonii]|uniref:Uncharacterized protein n=1 Tax=Solanum commersonii TaxID=4109 RepID=A0A9J5WRB9_SOLCO|nr:hypothetical protein H5410_057987 [Solanum commersonii]